MIKMTKMFRKNFLWFIATSVFFYAGIVPLFAGEILTDQIRSPSLEGNKLNDPATRNMTIYLPTGYASSGKSYPVVYLLHGYGGDDRSFIDSLGEFLSTVFFDSLVATGSTKEMIIVMPDAQNSYGGSFYTNSELIGNYEDYIVNELVNYIDSNYRTIASRTGRAISGASMGGYGAMKLAMKYSDRFCAVGSLCGPIHFEEMKVILPRAIDENPDGMKGPSSGETFTDFVYAMSAAFSPNLDNPPFFVDLPFEYPSGETIDAVWNRWLEQDPATMLATHTSDLMSLEGIYIDVGDEDELGLTPVVLAFHQLLNDYGISHTFDLFEGGHSDNTVSRGTKMLSFLSDVLPFPKVFASWDVDHNGKVDIFDLVLVGNDFGKSGKGLKADINDNGTVDLLDLVLVGIHFGEKDDDALGAPVWISAHDKLEPIGFEKSVECVNSLLPNYPNPFNPETWMPYQLAQDAQVSVRIYDAQAQLIRTLHLGARKAGVYITKDRAAYWDGNDRLGQKVASGLYFYTLQAGEFLATRKMLLVK